MRFPVKDLLELLANGVSAQEILADYPYLKAADIPAALAYAASQVGHPVVIAAE